MNLKNVKRGAMAVAVAAAVTAGSSAHAFVIDSITGDYRVWEWDAAATPPVWINNGADAAKADEVAAGTLWPANIELGAEGGAPATTLETTDGVQLMSLTAADWTGNGGALITEYVTAAAASQGIVLDPVQQAAVEAQFVAPILPGGFAPWQVLSDPNIIDVYFTGIDDLEVALAGFSSLQAEALFNAWFGISVPGAAASEVVKASYNGVTKYLYTFDAPFDAGLNSPDPLVSFSSVYVVGDNFAAEPVPVPATLALLALGAGLMMKRRAA